MRTATLAAIGCVLLAARPAAPANWAVNSEVDAPDAAIDGVCADALGRCTLRAAVQEAEAAGGLEAIEIPAGRFRLTLTGAGEDQAATGDLDFGANPIAWRLEGAGADLTSIEGKGDRVIDVLPGGDVQLYDLAVRKGRVVGDGGGILNRGTLALYRSTVERNRSDARGGGIANLGLLSLNDSSVLRNRSERGGGVSAWSVTASLDIETSTLARNRAGVEGGAIALEGVGTAGLENATLSGNRARQQGGGLSAGVGTLLMAVNVTLKGNRAGQGAGLENADGTAAIHLSNAILDGNGRQNCAGAIVSDGGNLYSDASCPVGALDLGSERDLGLGPLRDNGGPTPTHAIGAESLAVDFGNGPTCSAADQRGLPRYDFGVGLGACDSGAFELQGP